MSSFCIDYFVSIGASLPFKISETPQQSLPTGDSNYNKEMSDSKQSLEDLCMSAITDVSIMFPDEHDTMIEDDWIVADAYYPEKEEFISVQPNSSDTYPVIVFKRRKQSNRIDYLIDIKLVRIRDKLPPDYELVQRSISGLYSANLCSKTTQGDLFFAVKRAQLDFSALLYGFPIIDDICCMRPVNPLPTNYKGWSPIPPEYFTLIGVSSLLTNNIVSSYDSLLAFGISAHYSSPIGLCNLPFQSKTIDRYPYEDYGQNSYKLPVDEIPLFAFPHSIKLQCPLIFSGSVESELYASTISQNIFNNQENLSKKYFSFIFTNSIGNYFYVTCLRFYEKINSSDLHDICACYKYDGFYEYIQTKDIYCPKIICVISTFPFYRSMKKILEQFYFIANYNYHNKSNIENNSIESVISSLIAILPLPISGGRSFEFIIAPKISINDSTLTPISFSIPKPYFFPMLEIDFLAPLKCFPISAILVIFTLLLQESRIIFVGSSGQLLTEVMESFRALLFPLKWTSCYITRLPECLLSVVQAPGGFLLGLHLEDANLADQKHNYWLNQSWCNEIQIGSYVIDIMSSIIYECKLSSNKINKIKTKDIAPITDTKFTDILNLLPIPAKNRLKIKLDKAKAGHKYNYRTSMYILRNGEAKQFSTQLYNKDLSPSSSASSECEVSKAETLFIRDAFLVFLIEVLGEYQIYINPPAHHLSTDVYRSFNEEFSIKSYIEDSVASKRPLLRKISTTQMFASLIQQRQEGNNPGLVFFDKAGDIFRTLLSRSRSENDITLSPLLYLMVENWRGETPAAVNSCLESCLFFGSLPSNPAVDVAKSSGKSDEISSGKDLNLHVSILSPLVIPGPITSIELSADNTALPKWPQLSRESLLQGREKAKELLRSLHKLAYKNVVELNRGLRHLKSFDVIYPSIYLDAGPELQFIAVASSSISMLSMRMTSFLRPVSDILQILGIIAQIGKLNILKLLPENVWRSIFVACNKCGGYLMRRIALILFNVLSRCGIKVDAITYGLYIQAVSSAACHFHQSQSDDSDLIGSYVDTHLHLEEIGYVWYIQQLAILWLRFDDNSTAINKHPGKKRPSISRQVSFEAVDTVSSSINLTKMSGKLSCLRPIAAPMHGACIHISAFNYEYSKSNKFKTNIISLNERLGEILLEALPSDAVAESPAKTSPQIRGTSDRRKSWHWFSSPKSEAPSNPLQNEEYVKADYALDSSPGGRSDKATNELHGLLNFIQANYLELELNSNIVTSMSSQSPCPKCTVSLLDEEVASYWTYTFKHLRPEELMSHEDLKNAHVLVCPNCSTNYFPKLSIKYYSKDEYSTPFVQSLNLSVHKKHYLDNFGSETSTGIIRFSPSTNQDSDESANTSSRASIEQQNRKVKVIWSTFVDYLSPIAVNKLLDQLVFYEGEDANNKEWLCKNKPELYWNLVWYSTRFGFPIGLNTSLTMESRQQSTLEDMKGFLKIDVPILVNWRSSVGEAISIRILWGDLNHSPTLADLTYAANIHDLSHNDSVISSLTTQLILSYMDGTVEGMCHLIMLICPSQEANKVLSGNPMITPESPERLAYVTILVLHYLFNAVNNKEDLDNDPILTRAEKDVNLERIFLKAVDVLPNEKLLSMGVGREDLSRTICARDVQIFRVYAGFLF